MAQFLCWPVGGSYGGPDCVGQQVVLLKSSPHIGQQMVVLGNTPTVRQQVGVMGNASFVLPAGGGSKESSPSKGQWGQY